MSKKSMEVKALKWRAPNNDFWDSWRGDRSFAVLAADRSCVAKAKAVEIGNGNFIVRVYMIGKEGSWTYGIGRAFGRGEFCKLSAAFDAALRHAGFSYEIPVAGAGLMNALEAFRLCAQSATGDLDLKTITI